MIETVLGPLAPEQLGPTSMHEHLLLDARALLPQAAPGNLVLDDPELAAAELRRVLAFGQTAVVDPTVWGFGGPEPGLAEVARRSGVHVVAGVGAYVPRTRPQWLRALDAEALAAVFRRAVLEGLPDCPFRAGVIGMIAPGHPLSAEDERLLEAAGRAAAETGAAVIVRLDPRFRDGPAVLERLLGSGQAADRIVLSNIDGYAAETDLEPLRELAATGAVLKWCFGYETPPRPELRSARDRDRVRALLELLAEGVGRQVLACGIWTCDALSVSGGHGYDHLGRVVLPALRARGVGEAAIETMMVLEPRRLLDRPA